MSKPTNKDQRRFELADEHYATTTSVDGTEVKVLVGPYSLTQRNYFYKAQISLYLTRNPEATQKQANKAAFHKWRQLVFVTLNKMEQNNNAVS